MIISLSTSRASVLKDGTTTITAVVPESDFTIHIPADKTLEYGNTEKQEIGTVYVSDVKRISGSIYLRIITTDLTSDTNTITVNYYRKSTSEGAEWEALTDDNVRIYSQSQSINETYQIAAQVNEYEWAGAVASTYSATLTFKFINPDAEIYIP